jgi:hypothetical protein
MGSLHLDQKIFVARYQSILGCRKADYQPIQIFSDSQLTAQAAVVSGFNSEFHHLAFDKPGFTNFVDPCFVDITVAGRTATGTTTLGDDTLNHIVEGGLHDGIANFYFKRMFSTVVFDARDLGQRCSPFCLFFLDMV